jgi:magnesium-transporting ATPase (P-type)
LRRLLKATAVVIRDGGKTEIDAAEVVPEDLVVLVDGDRVPADGELIFMGPLRRSTS